MTATTTSIYYPALVGTVPNGAAPISATAQEWPVVAGSTVRRDLNIVSDLGAVINLTGIYESVSLVFSVSAIAGNVLQFERTCEVILRATGKASVQLMPADTAALTVGKNLYVYDVTAVYPDGATFPVIQSQPFTVLATAFVSGGTPSAQAALIPTGSTSSNATRVGTSGDSITNGGTTSTAVLGGWQWWYQHFCHLYGKDIVFVGPGVISDATPPTSVDGIAWVPNVMAFSGALINTIGGSLGIQPSWPGYATTFQPNVQLQMIATNNLQATSQHQDGDTAFAALTGLLDIQLPAFAALAQPCTLVSATVIPQGRTFTSTPAYPGYQNETGTDRFNTLVRQDVIDRKAAGSLIRLADPAARYKAFVGPFGEDWSGSIDGDAHAMAPPTGYTAVGLGGAVTPGLLADGLHPNWLGMRLLAEAFFVASFDLLADKV